MHKLLHHPAAPGRLYQQNHMGTYRSDDWGDTWYQIDRGLPHNYGFGLALHPRDPETCYVTPLDPGEYAFRATSARFRVYRWNRRGRWTELGRGLPDEAYLTVLREGMASDRLDPCGVYVGAESGEVFYSRDEGRTWSTLAHRLPAVLSVSAAVL